MPYYYDPDFIITISGIDVTKDVSHWVLHQTDDDTSTLTVTVQNQNSEYSGRFQMNSDATITFGYQGRMSPLVTMTVKAYNPSFELGIKQIKVSAMDDTEKLTGKSLQGCFKKGCDMGQAIKDTVESNTNSTCELNVKPPNLAKDYRIGVFNKTASDTIRYLAAMTQDPQVGSGDLPDKSIYDKDILPQQKLFQGFNTRGFTGLPSMGEARIDNRDDSKDKTISKTDSAIEDRTNNIIDKNRASNCNNQQHSTTVTAQIKLLGYPELKACEGVTILNVDDGSGDWYVNSVSHEWTASGGFYTSGSLQRGDIEKSGKGSKGKNKAARPMVVHSKIYNKKPTIYVGPRPTDAPSQATFTYGDGGHLISFIFSVSGTKNKDGGEKVNQKGNLRDVVKTERARITQNTSNAKQ